MRTTPPPVVDTVTTRGRGRGSSRAGRGTGPPSLPPLDATTVATFLAFDSVRKTVTFQVSAEQDSSTRQVTFNGARRGERTLRVPQGWRVTLAFTNHDADLPHSVMVVEPTQPIPEQLTGPAFQNAQTVKVEGGLLEGDSDEITFMADRSGRYLIACGVLDHARYGQWLTLEILPLLAVPGYR